ncbi:MAG: DUF3558 domain-containing protein [Rhodococcus sp.]|nr:DUF3558 domain-containing protein [Rhodococcus sp. (in: high G+C Gram-positive bacteria)]
MRSATRRSYSALLAGVAAVGLIASCSTGGDKPVELAAVSPDTLFDPCTDIPAEAIEEVGFTPSKQQRDEFGDDVHLVCSYTGEVRGDWLAIHAKRDGFLQELAAQELLSDQLNFTPIEIDGRTASLRRHEVLPHVCAVLVQVPFGTLLVDQYQGDDSDDPSPICDQVQATAETLLQYVPGGE